MVGWPDETSGLLNATSAVVGENNISQTVCWMWANMCWFFTALPETCWCWSVKCRKISGIKCTLTKTLPLHAAKSLPSNMFTGICWNLSISRGFCMFPSSYLSLLSVSSLFGAHPFCRNPASKISQIIKRFSFLHIHIPECNIFAFTLVLIWACISHPSSVKISSCSL